MKSVVVFCGANPGTDPIFAEAATHLGRILAERRIRLVFGGGSVGLMGVIADAVLAHGGAVTGIITGQLNDREVGHKAVADMHIVGEMSERKMRLIRGTDGVITLPGGYGTLDELFEVLCLAQLDQYHGPIGVLNLGGYYDPMLAQLDNMVRFGFLKAENKEFCIVDETIEGLLEKMSLA